jgi:hypothetical protein
MSTDVSEIVGIKFYDNPCKGFLLYYMQENGQTCKAHRLTFVYFR